MKPSSCFSLTGVLWVRASWTPLLAGSNPHKTLLCLLLPFYDASAPGDLGSNLTEVRAVLASLNEAITFCKKLAAAMDLLRALLCHPVSEVVQTTISVLTLCE
jgi:hypothetical protein